MRRQRKTSFVSKLAVATILSIGLLFSLYGCQMMQQNEARVDIDEQPLDRRIGLVKSLGGVKTSSQGTHLLQLDDGSTILLKSLQINLDDSLYMGKTVEVRGLITYTTDGKQIMQVENIDVLQDSVSETMEEVSWKDYANAYLGFTIKYRSDFEVDDSESTSVEFSKDVKALPLTQQTSETTMESGSSMEEEETEHIFVIAKTDLSKDELLPYLQLEDDSSAELLAKGYSRSKVGAFSMDAIKKADGSKIVYFVTAGEVVYKITLDSGSDQETLSDQNLFYEMLSTFRVLADGEVVAKESDLLNNLEMGETEEDGDDMGDDDKEDSGSGTEEGSSGLNFEAGAAVGIDASVTQESIEGYLKLESDVFNFAMQYPKNWYYSGSAGSDSTVIRHYDFGSKPLDEEPGTVSMDITSGSIPSGTQLTSSGMTVTKVSSGGTVTLYVKGSGSRVYKITGPSGQESTLLQMAGSLEE